MTEPLLCPKCGALIGKHLERCYQCNTYLMGSRLDSWLTSLLPEKAQKNPATYLLLFLSSFPFLVVFLKLGPSSFASIPGYTMTQIGATNSALILMDQYWRFVTANFVHFNGLHLLMNMLGLFALGPLIEEMFDYKKCFFIFFSYQFANLLSKNKAKKMFFDNIFYFLSISNLINFKIEKTGFNQN